MTGTETSEVATTKMKDIVQEAYEDKLRDLTRSAFENISIDRDGQAQQSTMVHFQTGLRNAKKVKTLIDMVFKKEILDDLKT